MAGNAPILGSRRCIGGRQYEYVPPSAVDVARTAEEVQQQQQQPTTEVGLLTQMGQMLQTLGLIIAREGSYRGAYRSAAIIVPAGYQNYQIPIGFPVRRFYFDTALQMVLRLSDPSGDPIVVNPSYGTTTFNSGMGLLTPIDWKNIPAGLAFDVVYATNLHATADQVVYIFAMG